MARFPRVVVPGVPLHVIQRGNNRTATFLANEDFRRFRALVLQASHRYGCAIHAYALMTNHVHLMVTPDYPLSVARMMQAVGRDYVPYFNARYGRTGTLWEGRYRSSVIDSERYLLACSRYIELNPLRAQIAKHPAQYPWCSYRHNACGEVDTLITEHVTYQGLGAAGPSRHQAYQDLFTTELETKTLEAIRCATRKGTPLGDEEFCQQLEAHLRRPVRRAGHGGVRRRRMSYSEF
ncbi:MAG: transposase [Gemmatimonadales bacterium]